MIIGLDVLAGEVWVTDDWLKLLVLKVGVRGGELLGRLFPCEEPFLEFFLGELCRIKVTSMFTSWQLFSLLHIHLHFSV